MDPTSVITIVGVGQVLAAIMQVVKVWLETWLKPGDPKHDPTIQLTAGLLGVAGYVVHAWTLGPLTGTTFWDAAGQGFLAGLAAIVTYHVLTSSAPAGSSSKVDTVKQQVQVDVTANTADAEASLDRVAAKVAAVHAAVDALPVALVPAVQPPTPPPAAAVEDASAQTEVGSAA